MADALPPEERETRAAELALGMLEGEARADALRLQLADAAFRESVASWERWLARLFEAWPEATPPDLWPAIEARLSDSRAVPESAAVASLHQRLRVWRIGALASGAVAAALAIMVVLRPGPQTQLQPQPPGVQQPAAPTMIAQLGDGKAPAQLVANYDPASAQLRIRAIMLPSSSLAPELWVIPSGGAPHSLGLVAASGAYQVTVPQALRPLLQDGATLAVTMEQRDGAPHDAPSSAPVAAGTMHKI